MNRRALAAALCLAALPLAAAASEPAPAPDTGTKANAVSVSLDGSRESYGGSLSEELRSGLGFECASELELGRSAFNWELELYYDHSRNEEDGSSSRAESLGLDLAKLMLARWHGRELKTFHPYLLAGAELTWLREENEDGEVRRSNFMSPTSGIGAEFKLTKKMALKAEYRSNFAGGARRMSGLTLGLSYAILGSEEDEE